MSEPKRRQEMRRVIGKLGGPSMIGLALTVSLTGCPQLLSQIPVAGTPARPGATPAATANVATDVTTTVTLKPLQAAVTITLTQPFLSAAAGLTGAAGLTSVSPLAPSAAYRAAYRRVQDAAASDFAESPVPNSIVIALATTGGQQIVGSTDSQGQVILNLDVNKVYYITAPFVDALGAYREFRTIVKVRKEEKDNPPPQSCTFASTLVTSAITNANGGDFHTLKSIDVSQVKKAVDATETIIKAKPKVLAAVLLNTNAANPDAINTALKTISIAKQSDPTLNNIPAPTDAVQQAKTSQDSSNSLKASGESEVVTVTVKKGQDANQVAQQQLISATPAPTPAPTLTPTPVSTATPTPVHVKSFDFAAGMPTQVFIPLTVNGSPVYDPAYPRAALLSTNTLLTDGTTIPVASWSIAAGDQGGKITVDSGILRIDPSSLPGYVNVLAVPILDSTSWNRIQPIQLLATPVRVASASVSLPAGVTGLTVPADFTVPGDNNLSGVTSVKLNAHLIWNDQHASDLSTASSQLTWSTSTPNLVSVDQDGAIHALANTSGGLAVVTVTANFPVPPTNLLVATPSATIQIPVQRSSKTVITIQ